MDPDEALHSLVAGSGDRLLRLAYQLTHDRSGAEHVGQEAMMTMYASRRRVRASTDLITDRPPDKGVPSAADGMGDRDVMWRALGALPARQRTVLVLRYGEDLPAERIAELIGARPATAGSLAARGLAAMRTGSFALARDTE